MIFDFKIQFVKEKLNNILLYIHNIYVCIITTIILLDHAAVAKTITLNIILWPIYIISMSLSGLCDLDPFHYFLYSSFTFYLTYLFYLLRTIKKVKFDYMKQIIEDLNNILNDINDIYLLIIL